MAPWEKGISNNHKAFVIEVHIKDDKSGVQTSRNLQDQLDERVVKELPNQGLEHASFGLMQEAMRQEALFQALILLSEKGKVDRDILKQSIEDTFHKVWKSLSEEIVNLTIDSISQE